MALNPAQGETVGWPRFVQTVSSVWQRIPIDERRRTAIFTDNRFAGSWPALWPRLRHYD